MYSGIEIALFLFSGTVLLFLGGEGLVRGSSSIALRAGLSPLVVGLTFAAFGTSGPELVVSVQAAMIGNSAIALGNVIGSNIANIALILGVAALIRPLNVHAIVIKREIPIMLVVSLILVLFLLDGALSFIEGIIFVSLLVIYVSVTIILARKEISKEVEKEFEEEFKSKLSTPVAISFFVVGIGILVFGAYLFVEGAVALARIFNISDIVIGITVVALGTSLPELVTAVVASIKKESDIVIGTAVGSNIFNILSILGISAIIFPISAEGMSYIDLSVMMGTAILLLPLSWTNFRISRMEGFFLVVAYVVYIYFLIP